MAVYPKHSFIEEQIRRHTAVVDQIKVVLASLTDDQLNWRPGSETWSIAQIIDHLVKTHEPYIAEIDRIFKEAESGTEESCRTAWLGAWIDRAMRPASNGNIRRLKAPAKLRPSDAVLNLPELIQDFSSLQKRIGEQLENAKCRKISTLKIPMPTIKLLKLPICDVWRFIASHNERHLLQMQKVQIQMQEWVVNSPEQL